jgi:hypothetical protein
LAAAQLGQSARAFALDERGQGLAQQGGAFLNARQGLGLFQQGVVEIDIII